MIAASSRRFLAPALTTAALLLAAGCSPQIYVYNDTTTPLHVVVQVPEPHGIDCHCAQAYEAYVAPGARMNTMPQNHEGMLGTGPEPVGTCILVRVRPTPAGGGADTSGMWTRFMICGDDARNTAYVPIEVRVNGATSGMNATAATNRGQKLEVATSTVAE